MTLISNEYMKQKEDPFVIHTWRNNKISNTVILSLPHTLAKKYEIQAHSNLLVIDTGEGILLKKYKRRLYSNGANA
jgi:hypothetical protein